ncbi:MAG: hypothetical protein JWO31_2313 [Phycisphaerales bacterium]|nr:hypothetical protein [Phycisphaerales bacterium]
MAALPDMALLMTRPVLPSLPCLPPAERNDLVLSLVRAADKGHPIRRLWMIVAGATALTLTPHLTGTSLGDGHNGPRSATSFVLLMAIRWIDYLVLAARVRPTLLAELRARGLCEGCGYDLRATPQRCPECGRSRPL